MVTLSTRGKDVEDCKGDRGPQSPRQPTTTMILNVTYNKGREKKVIAGGLLSQCSSSVTYLGTE